MKECKVEKLQNIFRRVTEDYELNGETWRVFVSWLTDSPKADFTHGAIAVRLGMQRKNVTRAFGRLVAEGILIQSRGGDRGQKSGYILAGHLKEPKGSPACLDSEASQTGPGGLEFEAESGLDVEAYTERKQREDRDEGREGRANNSAPGPLTSSAVLPQNPQTETSQKVGPIETRVGSPNPARVSTGPLGHGVRPSISAVVRSYSGDLSQSGRYQEMLRCCHELKSYGYTRPELLASYNQIRDRWIPGPAIRKKKPKASLEAWLAHIEADVTLAINETFPVEAPAMRSRNEIIEEQWIDNVIKLGRLARIERT